MACCSGSNLFHFCRLFKDELRVMDTFRSFQRYFFMDAGDWAEHLIETLSDASAQHGILHEHSVQSMLESSFKGSSAEHDATSANLRISLQIPPSQGQSFEASPTQSEASPQRVGASPDHPPSRGHSKSVQVDNHSLRALDTVQLSYDLEWPLALVITQVLLCQACCCCVCTQILNLVLIGLLYKAYPFYCQHRFTNLLRLRPHPVRGHRLL